MYTQWHGKPSIAMLRWRDDRLDRFTKQRCHDYLKGAVTTAYFPNVAEELADPGLADESYQAATQWLLDRTRDKTTFRLLFMENINYGFRRNMLGLRPFGIVVSLAVALVATGAAVEGYRAIGEMPSMVTRHRRDAEHGDRLRGWLARRGVLDLLGQIRLGPRPSRAICQASSRRLHDALWATEIKLGGGSLT